MITGKQRSKLKSIANGLNATASIGKSGITDNVIKAIDDYLAANEIIKVSIQEGAELDPKVVCNDLAEKLNAEFVQAIGRKFVLYRRAKAKDKRKIQTVDKARPSNLGSGFFYVIKHMKYQQIVV